MAKTQNAPARERFVSGGRRVLLAALVVSLIVHLLLAGYVPWRLPVSQSSEETRIARVRITHIERVHPPPPPTPSPKPAVHSSIAPPKITSKTGKPSLPHALGPVAVHTAPVRSSPTPSPSPAASATPLGPCGGHKDAEPAVEATPDAVDIPPEARASKTTGTSQIKVSLDADGRVTAAAVAQSSGSAALDAVAVQLARDTTYTPRYINCKGVAGEFLFSVHFAAL